MPRYLLSAIALLLVPFVATAQEKKDVTNARPAIPSAELKKLESKLNCLFWNSQVSLDVIFNKIMVCGQAHDIEEAQRIIDLVRLATDREAINLLQVTGERQVALHVVIAEIDRKAARDFGLSALTGSRSTIFTNATGELGICRCFTTESRSLPDRVMDLFGVENRAERSIDFLRRLDLGRSLAEPVLTTINGTTASFQAGGEFPVPLPKGQGLQGVSFVPFGTQLAFTPFITDKDRIRLQMTVNVATRDLSTGITVPGSSTVGLNTRNFHNTVELRDGETLLNAGFLQTTIATDANRMPKPGELPVIGNSLGRRRVPAGEKDLVILVRPELVHPYAPETKVP